MRPAAAWRRLLDILEMIKFEHTVFALPFALIGLMLAARHQHGPGALPGWRTLALVLVAMVGARSAAMAFNRIADARYDAANPRTARRAIPSGVLTVGQVTVFTVAAATLMVWAAYQLNPLCFALSPLALLAVLGYSYTKRFTPLSHLVLGAAIGIAPTGAWIAVTGRFSPAPVLLSAAVMLWIGAFDIIYALQDTEFDRRAGLRSLPETLGNGPALRVARWMHAAMLGLLVGVGVLTGLGALYYVGLAVAAALIAYEHTLVSPTDLSRVNAAFFTMNGWVSVSLCAFVALEVVLART